MAYWYQTEHAAFPPLSTRDALRPPLPADYPEARERFFAAVSKAMRSFPSAAISDVAAIRESFYAGRFAETLRRLAAR